jgi:hypothetical protein
MASQVADDPVPDLVKPDAGQVQEKSEPLCVLIKLAPQVAQLVEFSQVVQPSQSAGRVYWHRMQQTIQCQIW